eukprot:675179-Rhodomonas_salina.4
MPGTARAPGYTARDPKTRPHSHQISSKSLRCLKRLRFRAFDSAVSYDRTAYQVRLLISMRIAVAEVTFQGVQNAILSVFAAYLSTRCAPPL